MQEKIIILDFGSQYTQLIARRLRELNTYCELLPYNKFPFGNEEGIKGVILSGSPYSVNDPEALQIDLSKIRGKYPLLGVCYGAQYIAHSAGGKVEKSDTREYGRANLAWHDDKDPLMHGIRPNSQVWMSHGDSTPLQVLRAHPLLKRYPLLPQSLRVMMQLPAMYRIQVVQR